MSNSTVNFPNTSQFNSTEELNIGADSMDYAAVAPLYECLTPLVPSAIVFCEGNFGKTDGKTANGLVRHSQNYRILSVIDSHSAGLDSGEMLDNKPNGIPIVSDIIEALNHAETIPDYFIFGIAPSSGFLSDAEKAIILDAMSLNMNIVNGLHEFLNDDPIFKNASIANNVHILDIRKPKKQEDLHTFSGKIHDVSCPRVAIMGTDCALGKRTTATILAEELRNKGLNVVMIATGQTGIMQGAAYCVALDAVPSQFCAGELEAVVLKAYQKESPDIIIIEGQGALSHPAFSTSSFILRGSCPTGIILQHAPKRLYRVDFSSMPVPSISSEINLIETFANTSVIGISLNHEGMSSEEMESEITACTKEFDLLVTDPLTQPKQKLVEMVLMAYPLLAQKLADSE
ncbi:DUF1611 domain-containing protein [Agarivorans sp. B2Z047]|uniref:DUF1611 domain-containing protein n=1 Tax=Agarivorans sp. B2Z047 TaxID=2652721 RepID=UPI00128ADEC7|nr:DUF1611 domain-containing protein [Agarivorans sp. B2Z047]MPW29322.1 DUF1611 domain-containing protein [Agarivorans sp. B2Z047]UQN44909.1 DUF1611 domain-containing protein [Agarivorans sp. B2Z047]